MKSSLSAACLAGALALATLPTATLAQAPATAPAPGTFAEMENAGKLAAQAWLVLLDRRDWGTAWDTASQPFRQSVPLGNWMDAIPKLRLPWGNLQQREPAEVNYKTQLAGRPEGQYVSVLFTSQFDQKNVQEIVTVMRDVDGRFRVIGYSPTVQ